MRIEAYTQVQQIYNTRKAAKTETAKKASFADQVQISSKGKDIQTAKQAVNAAEDVTAPIKTAIDNGTYSVDEESFAAKLYNKYYNEMR